MKISDKIAPLRRSFPHISVDNGKYLYKTAADLNKRGDRIVMYILLWSDDGRVSLHRTEFGKSKRMHVAEWSGWLQVNAPRILVDNVLPFVNRSFGSGWNIDRIFGWHFVAAQKKRAGR